MMKVQGEVSGLKNSVLKDLASVYDMKVPTGQIITNELAAVLLRATEQIGRETAVYINRYGRVVQACVGDFRTVRLPDMESRKSEKRLSGIRCIHTHPSGSSELSGADISSLEKMRFDVMAAVAGDAEKVNMTIAFLDGEVNDEGRYTVQSYGPCDLAEIHKVNLTYLVTLIDKKLSRSQMIELADESERALLLGLDLAKRPCEWTAEQSIQELRQLAETAGAEVVGAIIQKRDAPDSGLFFGKGKLEEISLLIQEQNINLIICDDELSPSQQRNIEQFLGVKVIDRTSLILDIFAQRARSYEGKLQVELAQLKYNLPRIGGQGLVLSRLGGGIGTRGPGETKLEVDKRRIRSRISEVEQQIENVKKHRTLHRSGRISANIPLIALVGYTNAGKSTLLNTLTAAGVLAEDKLFATLDPTTRRITLPNGQEVLLTDTVGFIQKLPHQLVSAFRSTLEEVQTADLLLHVVDASNKAHSQQMEAVINVLRELKSEDKPTITLYNKADCLDSENAKERLLRTPDSLLISAKHGAGMEEFMQKISDFAMAQHEELELLIPYSDSGAASSLHDDAVVLETDYRAEGTYMKVSIGEEKKGKYIKYKLGE